MFGFGRRWEVLAEAFPKALREEWRAAGRAFPGRRGWIDSSYESDAFEVRAAGEILRIPSRVHFVPVFGPPGGVSTAARMADCLRTRSTDGFERQRALRRIIDLNQFWSVPFVVALVGEYVLPILEDIYAARQVLDGKVLGAFLRDNPRYHNLLRARVMSYWDAYYRDHPRQAYVGFKLLDTFDAMTREDVPRAQ